MGVSSRVWEWRKGLEREEKCPCRQIMSTGTSAHYLSKTHKRVCVWGPGYVKVMADGALGRQHCDVKLLVDFSITSLKRSAAVSGPWLDPNKVKLRIWRRLDGRDWLTSWRQKRRRNLFSDRAWLLSFLREQHPSSILLFFWGDLLEDTATMSRYPCKLVFTFLMGTDEVMCGT